MEKNWQKVYTRPITVQDTEVLLQFFWDYSGSTVDECIYVPLEGKWEAWYPTQKYNQTMKSLSETVFDKDWTLEKYLQDFEKAKQNMLASAKNMAEKSSSASREDLKKMIKHRFQVYRDDYDIFVWMPWAIAYYLEDWFVKELKNKYGEKWQELYEKLATCAKPIQLQQMVERIWQWYLDGKNEKEKEKIIQEFSYQGGYSINDKYWTWEEMLNQAGSLEDSQGKLEKAKQERGVAKKLASEALEQLKSDDEKLHKVGEVINEYIWLRTERIDLYKKELMTCQSFYRRIEKEFDWEFGAAGHMSLQEILNALDEDPLPKDELKRRAKKEYIVDYKKDFTKIISDVGEAKKFLDNTIGDDLKVDELFVKGQVACKGKIEGKARVLLHADKIDSFQKGEILIANMTHPDYMPAIRKASAIVTDEGGIVCHAAIISRELKIPCVIGAGDATKVFKTGDFIEVDAEKGIVKKI